MSGEGVDEDPHPHRTKNFPFNEGEMCLRGSLTSPILHICIHELIGAHATSLEIAMKLRTG